MYYLIHKQTGEIKEESESKGKLRKRQKAMKDKIHWKISLFAKKQEKKTEAEKEVEKEIAEEVTLSKEIANKLMRQCKKKYSSHTQSFRTEEAAKEYLAEYDIEDFQIIKYDFNLYFAFYDPLSFAEEEDDDTKPNF